MLTGQVQSIGNRYRPQQRSTAAGAAMRSPLILAGAGVALFHIAWTFQGDETRFWLPGLGLGIALLSWLGWRILPVLFVDLMIVRFWHAGNLGFGLVLCDALLFTAQIGLSWWLYYRALHCSRWLEDPRSATLFLVFMPGALSAIFAIAQAFLWLMLKTPDQPLRELVAELILMWLSRMVGILVVVPFMLVVVTPLLLRLRLSLVELPTSFFGEGSVLLRSRRASGSSWPA